MYLKILSILMTCLVFFKLSAQKVEIDITHELHKNYSEIIHLVIDELKSDNVKVYYRFDNREIFSVLRDVMLVKEIEIYEKADEIKDTVESDKYIDTKSKELQDASLVVKLGFENINIYYHETKKWAAKINNKSIKNFFKDDYEKNVKNRPMAFISTPIISVDKKKAIIYSTYICGELCGSVGFFYLKNVNEQWEIIDFFQKTLF